MPLSSVPVPVVNDAAGSLGKYSRREPESYTEAEKEQIFVALARQLTRLKEQRRATAALDLVIVSAAVSPTTTTAEVEAIALWQRAMSWPDRYSNTVKRLQKDAEKLDPDVYDRWRYLQSCLDTGWDEGRGRTPLDAIRLYWDFPEHYLKLLDEGGTVEQRVQDLTSELSRARKAAAELSRQALDLLTEATRLEFAVAGVDGVDPSPAVLLAREQVTELRGEADRLTATAEEYRARAEMLLGTLNAVKPGYENHDGTPTVRVSLPLEVQRQVHDRDGGRCVKCASTFKLQIDHVVPLSKGGSNEIGNLQVLCMACNTAKGNRYIG